MFAGLNDDAYSKAIRRLPRRWRGSARDPDTSLSVAHGFKLSVAP